MSEANEYRVITSFRNVRIYTVQTPTVELQETPGIGQATENLIRTYTNNT